MVLKSDSKASTCCLHPPNVRLTSMGLNSFWQLLTALQLLMTCFSSTGCRRSPCQPSASKYVVELFMCFVAMSGSCTIDPGRTPRRISWLIEIVRRPATVFGAKTLSNGSSSESTSDAGCPA